MLSAFVTAPACAAVTVVKAITAAARSADILFETGFRIINASFTHPDQDV
jgi:hypothetical protein